MRSWIALVVLLALDARARPACAEEAAPLPSRDTRWYAIDAAVIDTGSLPRTSPGLSLGLDVRRGGLGAHAVASAFSPQVDHATGASIAMYDAMTMICAIGPVGRFYLGACGGGGVGLLHASARGESDVAFRPQVVAITRLDFEVDKVLLFAADVGAVLDPLRSRLDVGGATYRASLVSLRASLGVHVRFW